MADRSTSGLLLLAHPGEQPPMDLRAALGTIGLAAVSIVDLGRATLATWGRIAERPTEDHPLELSLTNSRRGRRVAPAVLAQWLATGALGHLGEMLPPFAAVGLAPGGVRVVSDHMGVRQLYQARGEGWSAVATSARALAALTRGGLDQEALLLQSQLGWQLSDRTLFHGVSHLPAGRALLAADGRIEVETVFPAPSVPISMEEGITAGAAALRDFMEQFLDENHDPLLQLTGGQDSRLVLSAVPPARRRALHAMTLEVPGSDDARIAGQIAARYGMRHTVVPLTGLSALSPAESFGLACRAASEHDCMADPLARAAIQWAENSLPQGARLSGIGGEIARGFYYSGWVRPKAVTRRRAEQLAKWRMFTNEPVESAALVEPLAARALPVALDLATQAIASGGHEWYAATDQLYFRHRMQRWMGVCESATALVRAITNPMLDDRFLAVSLGLSPHDKHNARFLGRLQVALDGDLASIPLDGRPAPHDIAYPTPLGLAAKEVSLARRVLRKTRQRLQSAPRPAAGATVIAGKLTRHLRDNPTILEGARAAGVFDEAWLDAVASGETTPAPSSLALLVNVIVATEGVHGSRLAHQDQPGLV